MNYLECIENEELEKLRLYVLGPDTYIESAEFCVQELSSEDQVSFFKKIIMIDEINRPDWLRFIQRYMLYHQISEEAVSVLFDNIHISVSLDLLIKIINMQGYNESQGKSLCIFMLHCDDLKTILVLSQLIYLKGHEFSITIYQLLNNLDRHLLKSGCIDMECFAETYLQTAGQYSHLFKLA
jgi:hypothetical protein